MTPQLTDTSCKGMKHRRTRTQSFWVYVSPLTHTHTHPTPGSPADCFQRGIDKNFALMIKFRY